MKAYIRGKAAANKGVSSFISFCYSLNSLSLSFPSPPSASKREGGGSEEVECLLLGLLE
jgi:hypothetical protein